MGQRWDQEHPVEARRLTLAWRKKNPKYMNNYYQLLKLYTTGKIKLQIGESLMDYKWMLTKPLPTKKK